MQSWHGGLPMQTGWLAEIVARLRAQSARGAGVEEFRDIVGREVRIRYGDPALADALGRATRHLPPAARGTPDLTIDCWTEPDGLCGPSATWPATGTVYVDDGTIVLTWDAPHGPLFVYDRTRRHAWALFASLTTLSWELATPFRRILHWWAADHGLQMVHAAAVGHATGGLLLVGRSGSGKSTTALACLDAGLGFSGDDCCLLVPGDPTQVHSLYLSGKADSLGAALLPGLHQAFAKPPLTIDGKTVLFADQIRPDGVCTGFPLRGIVVPRITGQTGSRLTRIRPAAALRALAPSTVLQMPGNRSDGLERLAAVVRPLPAWELALGSVPADAAELIRDLLAEGVRA